MTLHRLQLHRRTWRKKEILRHIYGSYFRRIDEALPAGDHPVVVELGAGPGFFKEHRKSTIATDVIAAPWLDICLDAERLPFKSQSIDAMVLIDVVHHLARPGHFFAEAQRVLRTAGRVLILDVHLSLLSFPVYYFFHHEPVIRNVNPLDDEQPTLPSKTCREKQPFDGNQAITSLLFGKYFAAFQRRFPRLHLVCKEYHSFLLYPLSGGFEHSSFVPPSWVPALQAIEKKLAPLGKYVGFRNFIVLEKGNPLHFLG